MPGDTIWSEEGYYKNNNFQGVLGIEKEQERFHSIPDSMITREVLNVFPYDGDSNCTIKNLPHIYVPRKGDVARITRNVATYYKILLEWELGKTITLDADKNAVFAENELLTRHIFQHNYYFMAGDNVLDSNDSIRWNSLRDAIEVRDLRNNKVYTITPIAQ